MSFDVMVIGGGHAGVEAAAAAARRGARVALVTSNLDSVGAMSCNPAIGGIGKGHIVREIDALDGIMAVAADEAAIHHRLLNRSKGAAVHGPRIQADRTFYARAVQSSLEAYSNIQLVNDEVVALVIRQQQVCGVRLASGTIIDTRTVVIATGTFLGACMFQGRTRRDGGRIGERAATDLASQLRGFGLPVGRLKTGTPPRLDGRTVDWCAVDRQSSDDDAWTMSALSSGRKLPQIACGVTKTSGATHDIVRAALDGSPLYDGSIDGRGPRYCPSFEDKVVRFGDREGHQLFLEPEGLRTSAIYPNGLSLSLDRDAQDRVVRSIHGLERTTIIQHGYSVEYDYLDPRALDRRLAVKILPGLYCAGQINGTTGYEEAAGQGLVAGLNAAGEALGKEPVVLDRASSYIGVMIDDLTLQGVAEPYRMLTARAEYRLTLRSDNAVDRLFEIGEKADCLSSDRIQASTSFLEGKRAVRDALEVEVTASSMADQGQPVARDGSRKTMFEWLAHEGVDAATVTGDLSAFAEQRCVDAVLTDARYAPYLARQAAEIGAFRREERLTLPCDMAFSAVPGLSTEMVEKLEAARPTSLGAAGRIQGITPAALSAILLHSQRRAA